MVSGYGHGTANRRNTRRNISRRSRSPNMGYYPAVELRCNIICLLLWMRRLCSNLLWCSSKSTLYISSLTWRSYSQFIVESGIRLGKTFKSLFIAMFEDPGRIWKRASYFCCKTKDPCRRQWLSGQKHYSRWIIRSLFNEVWRPFNGQMIIHLWEKHWWK